MNESVISDLQDGIGSLCFYSEKANCLSLNLLNELTDNLKRLSTNSKVKAIVIKSKGDNAFCAGASLIDMKKIENFNQAFQFFSGFSHLILGLINSEKIVITRIHGKTVGGGCALIAGADYCLANTKAQAKLSELEIGIGPHVIGPILQYKMGMSHFSNLAISGDFFSANSLKNCGLYAKVVEKNQDLDEEIRRISKRLSKLPTNAISEIKKLFWQNFVQCETLFLQKAKISARLLIEKKESHNLNLG